MWTDKATEMTKLIVTIHNRKCT